MSDQINNFRSVVLAGERPGGSPISHAFNVSASVMVPVAGKPSLARVMQAIEDSQQTGGGIICGPAADVVAGSGELENLLQRPEFEWLAPANFCLQLITGCGRRVSRDPFQLSGRFQVSPSPRL